MTCSRCSQPVRSRGLCNAHYTAARRAGGLRDFPRYKPGSRAAEKFWPQVAITPSCWEWQGRVNQQGYGTLRAGSHVYAHRFAYAQVVGPVPDGLTLDHLCRNRRCVNPDHLEPVTAAENVRRAWLARQTA